MNLDGLMKGAVFGAIIAGIVVAWENHRDLVAHRVHVTPIAHTAAPTPSANVAWPKQTDESRGAQDAWLGRRALEFDKCAALHGTPTLGFGMRVVCLDSHAVKFIGEEHPPYE